MEIDEERLHEFTQNLAMLFLSSFDSISFVFSNNSVVKHEFKTDFL